MHILESCSNQCEWNLNFLNCVNKIKFYTNEYISWVVLIFEKIWEVWYNDALMLSSSEIQFILVL